MCIWRYHRSKTVCAKGRMVNCILLEAPGTTRKNVNGQCVSHTTPNCMKMSWDAGVLVLVGIAELLQKRQGFTRIAVKQLSVNETFRKATLYIPDKFIAKGCQWQSEIQSNLDN